MIRKPIPLKDACPALQKMLDEKDARIAELEENLAAETKRADENYETTEQIEARAGIVYCACGDQIVAGDDAKCGTCVMFDESSHEIVIAAKDAEIQQLADKIHEIGEKARDYGESKDAEIAALKEKLAIIKRTEQLSDAVWDGYRDIDDLTDAEELILQHCEAEERRQLADVEGEQS